MTDTPTDAQPDTADRYRIPDLVFQSYLLPVALDPGSEERIRDALRALLLELWDAPTTAG